MKTEKVLIVDDEKNIRLTLAKALEKLDVETETAVSGEEALERLASGGLSLVLLDLNLPGMDGMDVLKRIRAKNDMTKVIIITAHGTVDNAVEAMKLGAVDFIQKPFVSEEMRGIVAKALQRRVGFLRRSVPSPTLETVGEAPATIPEGAYTYDDCIQQAKAAIEAMDFAEAKPWAERAVALETSRPEAYNLLGILMELSRDNLQAQKYYRAALSIDPTYKPAQANLLRATEASPIGTLDMGGGHDKPRKKISSFLGGIIRRKDER
ncbi:MAG TPA: response regulator [bacterium]|nr:response regulator [bacterium]